MSKMVRNSSKILQQMLQDLWSASDHFETLCIEGLMEWEMFVSGKVSSHCFEASSHDINDFYFSKEDILHRCCQYLT